MSYDAELRDTELMLFSSEHSPAAARIRSGRDLLDLQHGDLDVK
jgi:hypothetical protein